MQTVESIYGGTSIPAVGRSTTTEMAVSRQAQEVQAAMVMAKKFPRDEIESFNRIIRACKRKTLAEQSMYEYPRGDTKVTGPSIRLAEAMAQNWGNLDFGIIELEQKTGESQVMAYAWDVETNTRQTKIFSVAHIRATKKYGNTPLKDPRDIYELVANQGARRLRACILGIIPGDVIDAAIAQCNATLLDGGGIPLIDLVRQVVNTFSEKYSVTIPMLEKYIGCKSESFTMNDLIRLKKVHKSLQDGMAKREDVFELMPAVVSDDTQNPFPAAGNKKKGKENKPVKQESATRSETEEELGQADQPELNPAFIPDGQQEEPFT